MKLKAPRVDGSAENEMECINRACDAIEGNMASSTKFDLSQYAAQSEEDRQAILDEFMLSKLNDPTFVTLCKDIENCWRRIALGL